MSVVTPLLPFSNENASVELSVILMAVLVSVIGALLGAGCGLVPGMHINTVSLLLLSSFAAVQAFLFSLCQGMGVDPGAAPLMFAMLLTSAAVASSFIDFVPSTFLGAPDDSNVLALLPGHRLLLQGKGMEAVRCAADGSMVGLAIALLVVLPLEVLMRPPLELGAWLRDLVPYLLLGTVALLVLSEKRSNRIRTWIDARKGSISREEGITITPPVPVDGEPARLSGSFVHRHRCRSRVLTSFGDFPVRHKGRAPAGFITVRGIWRVQRRWWENKLLAASMMLLSGLLGFVAMSARLPLADIFEGMGQSPLFPLLTGLFGVPTLLLSLSQRAIPPQEVDEGGFSSLLPAAKGALLGFLAGWMPGITSTTGTVIGTALSKRAKEDREEAAKRFIAMVSSVGTSAVVFSLLALAIEGKGRTGAMLAAQEVLGDEGTKALSAFPSAPISLLLLSMLIAALLGHFLTIKVGRMMARRLGGIDLRALNLFLLMFILSLVLLFNGLPGLLLLSVSVLLGLAPPLLGISRVHLTGCLLVPLILFFFGLQEPFIGLLTP